jgi:uncharacterized protein YkvS
MTPEEGYMSNIVTKATELVYQMDNDQLSQIIEAVKLKRQHLTKQNIRSFSIGDIVEYQGKNGHTQGVVTKINRKYVVVDVGIRTTQLWRVPANMLTKKEVA